MRGEKSVKPASDKEARLKDQRKRIRKWKLRNFSGNPEAYRKWRHDAYLRWKAKDPERYLKYAKEAKMKARKKRKEDSDGSVKKSKRG